MKELEAENAKLKRMYAELALENAAIRDFCPETVEPFVKRQAAEVLVKEHGLSIGRACRVATCFGHRIQFPPRPRREESGIRL
jgi:putative transposase